MTTEKTYILVEITHKAPLTKAVGRDLDRKSTRLNSSHH